ncbi:unnamed protein product [Triticum aestivum]|uniref:Uncharacterized protein n=2 Tax=Triticum aestivum TaxID=4565 RepID=A0A9R1EUE2_WHEAT|nr:uncharacterized protein LOC123053685 [Triticum aestivum]KAF7017037.1 hypothetical protein CFC21_030534 [Triticum aestivum]SPT18820.1 unnamed protein product [Triticum aestivum]
MAGPRSSPSPPPPQARSADGGAHLSLFLDTDLGTLLALNVAADSTIRRLKSQVAVEHAAAFPDLGPVAVKSFQVLRKGAMYHLSDSMALRSAFSKVKAGCFLHVKMVAVATDSHYCRDEDRGRSSRGCLGVDMDKRLMELPATISGGVNPQMLEGSEEAAALLNVHAHDAVPNDVQLSSSSHPNTVTKKDAAVSLATDVQTNSVANVSRFSNQSNVALVGEELLARKENLLHSVEDHDLGVVSGDKQVGTREGTVGELHALDDPSQEKERKRARRTDSVNMSAVDPVRETNDYKTRDVNSLDKPSLETNTNSLGVIPSNSFQQESHGNAQEDSIQPENPIIPGKNKKRKKHQSVAPKDAQEITKPSAGTVEVPKALDGGLLHENQGQQGDGVDNVEMTSRDKAMVRPSDMHLPSSQLNSGSQLGTDAQATTDLVADKSNIGIVHEGYGNPAVGETSNSTSKVVAGEETIAEGINDEYHDERGVEVSNMEKGSKSENVLDMADTAGNISHEKNCQESNKVSSVGLSSMDTAEAKDQSGYSEKAAKSDIVSTQGDILNDPYKWHITSNVQRGDCNVIEHSDGDGKLKKKKRRHSESSKDGPTTQGVTKPSGSIANAQVETVNEPSKVNQGDSTVTENPTGDGKRKKKRKLRLESSKDDPLTKSSGPTTGGSSTQHASDDPLNAEQTTQGTIGEATGSACRKLDGTADVAATNVINEVLADLGCTDNLSGDPVKEHTEGVVSAALPLKYPADNQSDDLNDVLTENTVVPADGRTKSSKRQRKKTSLKHVSTDSSKDIQSLGVQVRQVPTEDLEGGNDTKEELLLEGSSVDAPASTGQVLRQKSRKSLKTQTPTIQEINHPTYGQDNQFIKDDQEKYVTDGGPRNDKNIVGAPTESSVLHKDGTIIMHDKPNARKGRKKSSKTELQSQDTALEQGSVADLMNSRAQEGAAIPKGSAGAVEPNDSAAIRSENGKINFLDHFSPSVMNGPSVSAENNDETTIREVKGKKKSKRKPDMQSQHAGIIEPNDLPESHLHTDKTSVADHFDTGNVGVPSVSAENTNREDGNVEKAKEKKKSKRKQDLVKPESENPIGNNEDTDNCSQNLLHSVVQKGRIEQGNAKENSDKITKDNSMPQQETEAENINREDGNVRKTKEKKKSKRKQDLVKPECQNPDGGNQDTDTSAPQKGRMDQGNAKEKKEQEKEDATRDSTFEKKPRQSKVGADNQTDLPTEKDHARMGKEQMNSTSQTKHHGKNRKHDGSIDGRENANPKVVSNVVQSSPISPQASNESTYGTPAVNRFRVAVRKVPRKKFEQLNDKSKKDTSKRGAGAIFSDTISEDSDELLNTMGEKVGKENSSDDSSTSADSGISSTAWEGSDVPDDEGIASLSQRSDINSVLRGSSSYKKARLKPTELLEDTEVPDSQPPDSLWG